MPERKLQIKEVLPYLPYELLCKSKDGIFRMDAITTRTRWKIWAHDKGNFKKGQYSPDELNGKYLGNMAGKGHSLTEIKPALILITDLTQDQLKKIIKHLFRNSLMIRPDYLSIKSEKGYITFYDQNTMQRYTAVKPGRNMLPVLNMSNHNDDYDVFFELHIDIYGLIEADIAINKSTLQ